VCFFFSSGGVDLGKNQSSTGKRRKFHPNRIYLLKKLGCLEKLRLVGRKELLACRLCYCVQWRRQAVLRELINHEKEQENGMGLKNAA
jgi:hypothetical protein